MHFVRGRPLRDSPLLQRYADSFAMIPNIEISVERLHAVVSQNIKIAHHHTPAYVSLAIRRQELLAEFRSSQSALSDMCSLVRDKACVVEQLGLQRHPALAHFMDGRDRLDASAPFLNGKQSRLPLRSTYSVHRFACCACAG